MSRVRTSMCLLAILVNFPGVAFAADFYAVQLQPSVPLAHEQVVARVSRLSGPECFPPATSLTSAHGTVTLRLDYSDTCQTGQPAPFRDYALGFFAAGSYRLIILTCYNNPPPAPSPCLVAYDQPFRVIGEGVAPAPALSLFASSILCVLFATFGLLAFARSGKCE